MGDNSQNYYDAKASEYYQIPVESVTLAQRTNVKKMLGFLMYSGGFKKLGEMDPVQKMIADRVKSALDHQLKNHVRIAFSGALAVSLLFFSLGYLFGAHSSSQPAEVHSRR